MKRVKKRGQTWSFDLIVAVILFIVVVALFYAFLSGDKFEDSIEGLESDVQTINSRLDCDISSDSGVCIIQKGKVSSIKVNSLAAKNYDEIKVELGISGDFCIYLRDSDGALIPMDGKAGIGKDTLLLINSSGSETYCGQLINQI